MQILVIFSWSKRLISTTRPAQNSHKAPHTKPMHVWQNTCMICHIVPIWLGSSRDIIGSRYCNWRYQFSYRWCHFEKIAHFCEIISLCSRSVAWVLRGVHARHFDVNAAHFQLSKNDCGNFGVVPFFFLGWTGIFQFYSFGSKTLAMRTHERWNVIKSPNFHQPNAVSKRGRPS